MFGQGRGRMRRMMKGGRRRQRRLSKAWHEARIPKLQYRPGHSAPEPHLQGAAAHPTLQPKRPSQPHQTLAHSPATPPVPSASPTPTPAPMMELVRWARACDPTCMLICRSRVSSPPCTMAKRFCSVGREWAEMQRSIQRVVRCVASSKRAGSLRRAARQRLAQDVGCRARLVHRGLWW